MSLSRLEFIFLLCAVAAAAADGVATEVEDGIWLVSFMHYDLGYIDLEQKTLQPIDNPFGTRLSPMSQEQIVTCVSGSDRLARASNPSYSL